MNKYLYLILADETQTDSKQMWWENLEDKILIYSQ